MGTRWAHLFVGDEPFLKAEAVAELKRELGDPATIAAHSFTPDDPLERVIELLDSPPLFTDAQFLLVKAIDHWPEQAVEWLLPRLEQPRDRTTLVLESDQPDAREARLRLLSERCRVRLFRPLDPRACVRWVQERAARLPSGVPAGPARLPPQPLVGGQARLPPQPLVGGQAKAGKRIGHEAAQTLVEFVGTELGLLHQAIEQTSLFVGERQEITAADIQQCFRRRGSGSTFELVDHCLAGEAAEAVRMLRQRLLAGEKPYSMVGALTWQLKRLIQLKRLLQAGRPTIEIMRDLRVSSPTLQPLMTLARRFTLAQLEGQLARLFRADWGMKRGAIAPELALELFVVQGQRRP